MKRLVLAVALAVAACGGPPPPPPAVVTLSVKAGTDQNQDPSGRANSVAVHLYQLASPARFNRADVFALLDREKEALGEDLLASETVLVPPGEATTLTRTMKPGTAVLGAAVGFRDIDSATWRVSAPVKPSGPTALELTTGANKAALKPALPPP